MIPIGWHCPTGREPEDTVDRCVNESGASVRSDTGVMSSNGDNGCGTFVTAHATPVDDRSERSRAFVPEISKPAGARPPFDERS